MKEAILSTIIALDIHGKSITNIESELSTRCNLHRWRKSDSGWRSCSHLSRNRKSAVTAPSNRGSNAIVIPSARTEYRNEILRCRVCETLQDSHVCMINSGPRRTLRYPASPVPLLYSYAKITSGTRYTLLPKKVNME